MKIPPRWLLAFALLLATLLSPSAALAHADPWGDLHPTVEVVDGNFAIHFNSSIRGSRDNYTGRRPVLVKIYSPEGKLLSPRHPIPGKRSWMAGGPVGLYGKHLVFGDTVMVFDPTRTGKPDYLLRDPDGEVTRHRLPWPKEVSLHHFKDVTVNSEGIAILGKEDPEILKFYWFEHGANRPPEIVTIGATDCIYTFPVASNIAYAGGRFWVAFMRDAAGKTKSELVMWSWKPGDAKARAEVLDSPAHWNCHLSMAAIGDWLCLAYHCATRESYYGTDARIFTVFKKAE